MVTKYVLTSYSDEVGFEQIIGSFDTYDEAYEVQAAFEALDVLNDYRYMNYTIDSVAQYSNCEEFVDQFFGKNLSCLVAYYDNKFHLYNDDWFDEIGVFDTEIYFDIKDEFTEDENLKSKSFHLVKYDASAKNIKASKAVLTKDIEPYKESLISDEIVTIVKVKYDSDKSKMFEEAAKEIK